MSDYRPDIWRLQAQSDVDGLIQALGNDDPGIRKRAAAALRALGAARAVASLTEALDKESDADARAHILAALDTLSDDAQVKPEEPKQALPEQTRIASLIAQLGSKQQESVITAAFELGESNDKLVVEPLVMLFNNRNQSPRVRLAAAEALLKLNSAPAEVSLLGALHSPTWQARRNAAAILGQLKAEWAVEPLGRALRDEAEIVRRTAFAALKYIATPESLKMLAAYRRATEADLGKKPPAAPEPAATADKAEPSAIRRTGLLTRVDASQADAPKPAEAPPVAAEVQAPAPPAEPVQAPATAVETPPASAEKVETPQPESPPAKLTWPKRKPPPTLLAPTRPLDPSVVDQAQERMKGANQKLDDNLDD